MINERGSVRCEVIDVNIASILFFILSYIFYCTYIFNIVCPRMKVCL